MPITWVTTVSSSGSDDNVVIKISHGIVVKMTTKIFTVWWSRLQAHRHRRGGSVSVSVIKGIFGPRSDLIRSDLVAGGGRVS